MRRLAKRPWLTALALPVACAAAIASAQEAPRPQPGAAPAGAVPAATPQGNAAYALLQEIEALKAEVARLRGQNELMEHRLESLGKRQNDFYLDLDRRIEELRKQQRTAAQAPPQPAAGAADPLAETRAYEEALEQFKAGNYDKAIAGFGDFLKAYPNSALAANAYYWSGYAHYAKKDCKSALEQQQRLVGSYPQSPKVPDALLNIASCQLELKDTAAAKKNLQDIVARYPGTNAATIAAKRLELLK